MPQPLDALVDLAAQHVDDVAGPEALAGAVDGRERLARKLGAVEARRPLQAAVAVAAAAGALLAEIAQEHLAAAARGLAVAEHRLQLLPVDVALPFARGVGAGQEAAQLADIVQPVEHVGLGRQAVAPGAAGLLVVGLEALGQVQVQHEAHVRLVDAHAEGDGGDHDQAVLLEEPVLVRGADVLVQPGMVGECWDAGPAEHVRGGVHLAARQAVDDAAAAGLLALEVVQELRLGLQLGHHTVADVGPVEAGDERAALAEIEPLDDLAPGGRVGRGGQRQARHGREALVQDLELEIVGPEVVAPLRDAVGLVDGEQSEAAPAEQVEESRRLQALRRHVDEVQAALAHGPLDRGGAAQVERRVEHGRPHAQLRQGRDLVLHQRDQRRHHDGQAVEAQGRHLVAQGLAAPGRHQDQGVAAGQDVADHLLLQPAEGGIAPHGTQDVERVAARAPGDRGPAHAAEANGRGGDGASRGMARPQAATAARSLAQLPPGVSRSGSCLARRLSFL